MFYQNEDPSETGWDEADEKAANQESINQSSINHQSMEANNGFTFADDQAREFKLAPEGTFFARCWRVVVLGTFEDTWQGQTRLNRKIRIDFELPTELNDFGNGAEPFNVSSTLNITMHENANYRKFLQNWRGRAYSEEEAKKGIDVSKFVGAAALVTVAHTARDNGKTYDNIANISPLPKGMQVYDKVNTPALFSVYARPFNQEAFDVLPNFLQEKIKLSREWADMHDTVKPTNQAAAPLMEEEDDLPF